MTTLPCGCTSLSGKVHSTDCKWAYEQNKKMTTENQIAIAETCGWTMIHLDEKTIGVPILCGVPPNKKYSQAVPLYPFVETLKQLGRFTLPQSASERKTVG